jgi:hypothetical protein
MVAKVDEQLIYDLVGFGESKRNISVNDTQVLANSIIGESSDGQP